MGFKWKKSLRKLGSAVRKAGPAASFIPGISYISAAAALVPAPRSMPSLAPMSFSPMAAISIPRFPPPARTAGLPSRTPSGGSSGGRVITMPSGGRVNAQKIWAAVRQLGPEAVAVGLGLGVGEMAEWLLANPPRKRRGKGITSRQLSNARRVNRVVCGWAKTLSSSPVRRKSCK